MHLFCIETRFDFRNFRIFSGSIPRPFSHLTRQTKQLRRKRKSGSPILALGGRRGSASPVEDRDREGPVSEKTGLGSAINTASGLHFLYGTQTGNKTSTKRRKSFVF